MQHIQQSGAKQALLDKLLSGDISAIQGKTSVIGDRPSNGSIPLSYNQEQVYRQAQVAERLAPGSRLYNETITIHRTGPLEVHALEQSLMEILRRHEAWRTTFSLIGDKVVQCVHSVPDLDLRVVDLAHMSNPERAALELAEEGAQKPFDLARGPLVRFQLIRLKESEYRLFLAAHQIVLDVVSAYNVFLPELVALYEAFASGQPSPLRDPIMQYPDYALWQRDTLANEQLLEYFKYWEKQLGDGVEVLRIPTDRPRPPIQSFRGTIQSFTVRNMLRDDAKALTKAQGNTLFVTLLAGFAILLNSYTDQEEIVIGTVAPTRCSEALHSLGYFLNPVVLHLRLTGDQTFRNVLAHAHEVVTGALSHAEMPFHLLVARMRSGTDQSRHPLYQVQFSLEPTMLARYPGWNLTPMDLQSGGARLDLYFVLDDRPAGMFGRVQYNPDLFEAASIGRMAHDYQTLLTAAIADPDKRVSTLPR